MLRINNNILKRLSRKVQASFRFRVQLLLSASVGSVSERSGVNIKGSFAGKANRTQVSSESVFSWIQNILNFSKDPVSLYKDTGRFDRLLDHTDKLIEYFKNIEVQKSEISLVTPDECLFEFQIKDAEFVVFIISLILLLEQTVTKPANQIQASVFHLSDLQKNKLSLLSTHAKDLLYNIDPSYLKVFENCLHSEID